MKRLVCEMCGSNELLKQDDRYICQACGTNYTTEEAKKLLIEVSGSVDVSGSTVKVDNSSFVQKSLENARRAKSKEDWEECEKYYNMVEQHDPKNIEAIFYSSYGKAKMAMVESDRFKREQKVNVMKNSISIIDDNYDPSPGRYEEQKKLIEQINADLMALVNGSFVYNTKTSKHVTTNDSAYTYTMFIQLCLGWIESLQNIIRVITEPKKTVYLWNHIRQNYVYVYNHVSKYRSQTYADKVKLTDEIIKKIDPSYQPTELPARIHRIKIGSGKMNSALKSFKIQKLLTLVATAGFILYAVLWFTSLGSAYNELDSITKLHSIMVIVSALLLGVSSLFLFKYANQQGKNFSTNTKPGWPSFVLLLFGVLLFVVDTISILSYMPEMAKVTFFSTILAMISLAVSALCFNTGAYKPTTIFSIITAALMLLSMLFYRGIETYIFTLAIISYSVVLLLSAPLHNKSNYRTTLDNSTLDNSFEARFLRNINNLNDD